MIGLIFDYIYNTNLIYTHKIFTKVINLRMIYHCLSYLQDINYDNHIYLYKSL